MEINKDTIIIISIIILYALVIRIFFMMKKIVEVNQLTMQGGLNIEDLIDTLKPIINKIVGKVGVEVEDGSTAKLDLDKLPFTVKPAMVTLNAVIKNYLKEEILEIWLKKEIDGTPTVTIVTSKHKISISPMSKQNSFKIERC